MSQRPRPAVAHMSDMRIGMTETEHKVLDLVVSLTNPVSTGNPGFELDEAFGRIKQARRTTSSGCASAYALEAAARLIRFAQANDRYLGKLTGDAS